MSQAGSPLPGMSFSATDANGSVVLFQSAPEQSCAKVRDCTLGAVTTPPMPSNVTAYGLVKQVGAAELFHIAPALSVPSFPLPLESAALVPVPSSNFHHTTVVFDEGFIWHVAQGRRLPPRM